jgi:hypothetical protein
MWTIGVLWGAVAAAAPMTVTHQGRAIDAQGHPIDGAVSVGVALYDVATLGTPFWTYTWPSVAVQDGYYAVTLGGSPSPALDTAAFARPSVYLQATVAGTPVGPRQLLTSVPYAIEAERARAVETQLRIGNGSGFNGTWAGTDQAMPNRKVSFTKRYASSAIVVHWYDNFRCAGDAADCRIDVRFRKVGDSGAWRSCATPNPILVDLYQDTSVAETVNVHMPAAVVAYCSALSGAPFDAGDWELQPFNVDNPGDAGSGEIVVGWHANPGWFEIREVY